MLFFFFVYLHYLVPLGAYGFEDPMTTCSTRIRAPRTNRSCFQWFSLLLLVIKIFRVQIQPLIEL
jgi:hypothetical protein